MRDPGTQQLAQCSCAGKTRTEGRNDEGRI